MSFCSQHGGYEYDECPICVREERDRLREENEFLANAMREEIVGLGLLRDERDRLRDEVTRLRDLIPQAWEAAQKRMTPNRSLVGAPPATFREWMESKGLL